MFEAGLVSSLLHVVLPIISTGVFGCASSGVYCPRLPTDSEVSGDDGELFDFRVL